MDDERVTAIVLCGGGARRMGGVDKPLVELAGKPLLGHVIDRLRPQVDAIVLAGARASDDYAQFGYPLVVDRQPGQGPLGGFHAALPTVRTPWVLTVPADTPLLPMELVESLTPACRHQGAAVVSAGARRQNLIMLLDKRRALSLVTFYEAGGRAARDWLTANNVPTVELSAAGFFNVNTRADLAQAEQWAKAGND